MSNDKLKTFIESKLMDELIEQGVADWEKVKELEEEMDIRNRKLISGEEFYAGGYNDAEWPPRVSREFVAWNSPSHTTRRDCLNGYFQ